MRLLLSVVLIVAGLGGCGTNGDPRLEVSDAVREACGDWFGGEENLQELLAEIESDRLGGISYDEEINYFVYGEGCCYLVSGSSCGKCSTCMEAIIDQIYGK